MIAVCRPLYSATMCSQKWRIPLVILIVIITRLATLIHHSSNSDDRCNADQRSSNAILLLYGVRWVENNMSIDNQHP